VDSYSLSKSPATGTRAGDSLGHDQEDPCLSFVAPSPRNILWAFVA